MDTKINLRISEYTKGKLEEDAESYGTTLSQYVREILDDHVGLEKYFDEDDEVLEGSTQVVAVPSLKAFEKTLKFTQLSIWLFYKYMYPIDTNHKVAIRTIKQYVEMTIDESSFSRELKIEFLKVLTDINRFLAEPDYERKQFYFSISNHQLYFNYGMLINEIWSKK